MKHPNANINDLTLTALFGLLVAIPLLGLCLGLGIAEKKEFLAAERRTPFTFSQLIKGDGQAGFPRRLESYVADNFPFREDLARAKSYLDYRLFAVSPNKDQVILGRSGYLFLGDKVNESFSQHSGRRRVDEDQIRSFIKNEKKKQGWMVGQGLPYVMVIAPDKASIYPEYLPAYVKSPNQHMTADLLVPEAQEAGLNVLDLRSDLIQAKKKYGDLLYAKTGTHWTQLGAYLAYLRIMEELEKHLGPLKKLESHGYKVRSANIGELARMIKIDENNEGIRVRVNYGHDFNKTRKVDLKTNRDLGDNPHKSITIRNNAISYNDNPLNSQKIFVLRDSFITALTPLLNQTFAQCAYVNYNEAWTRKNVSRLIRRLKPDVVLFEIVERRLISPGILLPTIAPPEPRQ